MAEMMRYTVMEDGKIIRRCRVLIPESYHQRSCKLMINYMVDDYAKYAQTYCVDHRWVLIDGNGKLHDITETVRAAHPLGATRDR
jgi:hypothetical protein